MNRLSKRVLVGLGMALFASQAASCTFSDTQASEVTCVYNGGPLDDSNYTEKIDPGKGRNFVGVFSETHDVPTGVRQYRVSLDPAQGDTPVADSVKVTVRGIPLEFEPTFTFTISTIPDENNKPAACGLIEQHLKAMDATDFNKEGGNWQYKFLTGKVRPVIDDVAKRVLQQKDPTKLVFNTDGERDKAAKEIAEQLDPALQAALGGNYFCSPSYPALATIDKCGVGTVILPAPFVPNQADRDLLAKPQLAQTQANNEIAAAQERARAAQQIADQAAIEAKSSKTLADAQVQIQEQKQRVEDAIANNAYAWCRALVLLSQDCDLVRAAESGDYPDIILGDTAEVPVAIPVTAAP